MKYKNFFHATENFEEADSAFLQERSQTLKDKLEKRKNNSNFQNMQQFRQRLPSYNMRHVSITLLETALTSGNCSCFIARVVKKQK